MLYTRSDGLFDQCDHKPQKSFDGLFDQCEQKLHNYLNHPTNCSTKECDYENSRVIHLSRIFHILCKSHAMQWSCSVVRNQTRISTQ